MIGNNKKSFSLAELLVFLLVTSMILAAVVPTVVKNQATETVNETWHKLDDKLIYALDSASNQKAIIGATNTDNISYSKSKLNIAISGDTKYHIGFVQNGVLSGTVKIDKDKNIAIGYNSLLNITTGSGTGSNNIAIGCRNLYRYNASQYTANDNIAIGYRALHNAYRGDLNTAYNIAIGNFSLNLSNSSTGSTAVGVGTLKNIDGSYNTAIGYNAAGSGSGSGEKNVVLGAFAAYNLTSGSRNTIIGYNAAYNLTSGSNNIIIGDNAGSEITTGSNNICIGSGTCSKKDYDYSNRFEIGYGENNNFLEGNMGTEPTLTSKYRFVPYGYIDFVFKDENKNENKITIKNANLYFNPNRRIAFNANGEIYINQNLTTYYLGYKSFSETSDARLKNILGPSTDGIDKINQIQVKKYTFKKDKTKKIHTGVIAQELQKIFPNSVEENSEGYLTISKNEMFYAMLNSIKELFAKIVALDKQITEIEKENQKLIQSNNNLKKQLQIQNKMIDEQYNEAYVKLKKLEKAAK